MFSKDGLCLLRYSCCHTDVRSSVHDTHMSINSINVMLTFKALHLLLGPALWCQVTVRYLIHTSRVR